MISSSSPSVFFDVGNTHTDILRIDGEVRNLSRVNTAEFIRKAGLYVENTQYAGGASVVPEAARVFQRIGVFNVSSKCRLPFSMGNVDPSTAGADRLANCAALLAGTLPALSIDFGTAITFELLTKEKVFAGGAIMPGRMLARTILHDHTAQLPLIDFYDAIPETPGENTCDAIRLGTDLAAVGAVKELIGLMRASAGGTLRIVGCGGDRGFFLSRIPEMEDGGATFTLDGIMRICMENCP